MALSVAGCSYGQRKGEHESLVAGLDAAEEVLLGELHRVFGDFTVVDQRVTAGRCEPLASYSAGITVWIVVPGVARGELYDMVIAGREGLNEVVVDGVAGKAAGFEIDGIAGRLAVFDEEGRDFEMAASTGCYEEADWGIEHPRLLVER